MKRKHFYIDGVRYRINRFYRVGSTMRVSGTSKAGLFKSTVDTPIKGLHFDESLRDWQDIAQGRTPFGQ